MSQIICQSCGMPMTDASLFSTNADGSVNKEYCKYCYENGAFLQEQTMEEMIASCIPFVKDSMPDMSEEQIRAMMQQTMPQLKRWQTV